MKKFFFFTNIFLLIFFYYKQKRIKSTYDINLTDIESESDILNVHGMYKDQHGNIYTEEDLYE